MVFKLWFSNIDGDGSFIQTLEEGKSGSWKSFRKKIDVFDSFDKWKRQVEFKVKLHIY
jgi:hypothetical protein